MNLYNKDFCDKGIHRTMFREELHKKKLVSLLNPKKEDKILEIGCNQGRFVKHLRNYSNSVIGCDVNKDALSSTTVKDLHFMSAEQLKFKDNSFDKVVSSHTIEHIPNVKKAINEMERILKPQGKCVLVYPFEIVRGMNNFFWAWRTYGNPLMSRKLHLHKLNPGKLDKMTKMKKLDGGLFLGPWPTYYTVFMKI